MPEDGLRPEDGRHAKILHPAVGPSANQGFTIDCISPYGALTSGILPEVIEICISVVIDQPVLAELLVQRYATHS